MATKPSPTVIIIGAGIAGLSAGVFAQRSGFKSRIYEMHTLPGGLMTAWKRKGFTIDGCIHWLVGTNPSSSFHKMWQDIGLIQDREIYDTDVFMRYEAAPETPNAESKAVNFYSDTARFEKHLLELAPEDSKAIREMGRAIRVFSRFEMPGFTGNTFGDFGSTLRNLPYMLAGLYLMMRMIRMPMGAYATRFRNPLLRETFSKLWPETMSALGFLMTMGWIGSGNAGYPIGGSLPMARAVEKQYCDLGGEMHYGARVEKILVEPRPDGKGSRAVGVRFTDGREERADFVISAADGHATLFDMLDGRFTDKKTHAMYDKAEIFPPILFIGLGVNNTFPDLKGLTGGISLPLSKPITIGSDCVERIGLVIHNFDATLAPEGKTVITIVQPTSYTYWKELSSEPERYEAEKQRVALEFIDRLDARFDGFAGQVEMADVATPLTFEHFTGNWQGSFEGWLPTPSALMSSISKTLPGLSNFYMAGQWVQAGGGLPSGVSTGKQVIEMIKKQV